MISEIQKMKVVGVSKQDAHRRLVYGRVCDYFAKHKILSKKEWHEVCETISDLVDNEYSEQEKQEVYIVCSSFGGAPLKIFSDRSFATAWLVSEGFMQSKTIDTYCRQARSGPKQFEFCTIRKAVVN